MSALALPLTSSHTSFEPSNCLRPTVTPQVGNLEWVRYLALEAVGPGAGSTRRGGLAAGGPGLFLPQGPVTPRPSSRTAKAGSAARSVLRAALAAAGGSL